MSARSYTCMDILFFCSNLPALPLILRGVRYTDAFRGGVGRKGGGGQEGWGCSPGGGGAEGGRGEGGQPDSGGLTRLTSPYQEIYIGKALTSP